MLRDAITNSEIKKIFRNQELKTEYMVNLLEIIGSNESVSRTKAGIDRQIEATWNYELSKGILRRLFQASDKYFSFLNCGNEIDNTIRQWNELGYGELSWPFAAMNFDDRVHRINNSNLSEEEKDQLIASEVIKFRRIKDINAKRNNYIEYLIFENNDNVIPTFKNNKGVDFYINGEPYDQKVSKSVGNAFIKEHGQNYRQIAIERPELVAKSLYENQDEDRFGDEPRLFVVYLDNDVSAETTRDIIINTNFVEPIHIEFDYLHSKTNWIHHSTHCFIVLLYH